MMRRSYFLSITIAFLLLCGLIYILFTQNKDFGWLPLMVCNLSMAAISLVSFLWINKGLKSNKSVDFLKAKYGAMFVKLIVCIGVIVGYVFYVGRHQVYKPAVYLVLGFYIVYAAIEAIPLSKIAKHK